MKFKIKKKCSYTIEMDHEGMDALEWMAAMAHDYYNGVQDPDKRIFNDAKVLAVINQFLEPEYR